MNGLWIFLTIVSVLGIWAGLTEKKMKLRFKLKTNEQQNDGVVARLEEFEKRLENIEAIVLEQEKHRSFDEELRHAGSRK